jgi:hypothetical protein
MNTLFADEVQVAKETNAGSIPFEETVTRVNAFDWRQIRKDLDEQGSALLPNVLSADECKAVASLYPEESIFRSRVVMGRHGFGRGEYKYFSYPLPPIIHGLRTALYPQLAPVANRWNEAMGIEVRYPESHADFIQRCHDAGQLRPTPLLLQYGPGDYNCLHQDLYGEHVFPIQVAILFRAAARFHRGRIRAHGATAPYAIATGGRSASPRGCGGLRGSPPARTRHARYLSRQSSARREPSSFRATVYSRYHLSRRQLRESHEHTAF